MGADQRTFHLMARTRTTPTTAEYRFGDFLGFVHVELSFYRLEGAAESDAEIQASIQRGMIGFPQAWLVKISTPYMRGGVLYEDFTRGWGRDDPDLLV